MREQGAKAAQPRAHFMAANAVNRDAFQVNLDSHFPASDMNAPPLI
jgi:hypothetical protein